MDWTSPRSSVTWWLSSGSGQLAAVDGGPVDGRDVDAETREPGGGRMGARGRRRSGLPADALERGAQLAGERGWELSERVADNPRPMPVPGRAGRRRLGAQEGAGRLEVEPCEGSECPGDGLLHVRLGVTDELGEQRQPALDALRAFVGVASDVRERGDRGADQAALPARRRVDELLQLRPAVRLREDP